MWHILMHSGSEEGLVLKLASICIQLQWVVSACFFSLTKDISLKADMSIVDFYPCKTVKISVSLEALFSCSIYKILGCS